MRLLLVLSVVITILGSNSPVPFNPQVWTVVSTVTPSGNPEWDTDSNVIVWDTDSNTWVNSVDAIDYPPEWDSDSNVPTWDTDANTGIVSSG